MGTRWREGKECEIKLINKEEREEGEIMGHTRYIKNVWRTR